MKIGLKKNLDSEDAPADVEGVIKRDITEQMLAEEKITEYTETLDKSVEEKTFDLKDSGESYRGFYGFPIEEIVSTNVEGHIAGCNHALVNMNGYTKEEQY